MSGQAWATVLFLGWLTMSCAHPAVHPVSEEMPDPHSAIFVERCTSCHNLEKIEAAHKTKSKAEMRETLVRHKDMEGSGLTEQDSRALLKMY